FDHQNGGRGGVGQQPQQPFEQMHMIDMGIERLAGRARDVTQRQKNFWRRQIFAGTPMQGRVVGLATDELFDQRGFAGACFRGERHNSPVTRAGVCEGLIQLSQLFVAL
ncbi:MAG: hypothetical protein QOF42_1062, partial [Gammaproteobacteria bacterium]|nr:hypothetical protein [Gammaproteobacteria bacterium]